MYFTTSLTWIQNFYLEGIRSAWDEHKCIDRPKLLTLQPNWSVAGLNDKKRGSLTRSWQHPFSPRCLILQPRYSNFSPCQGKWLIYNQDDMSPLSHFVHANFRCWQIRAKANTLLEPFTKNSLLHKTFQGISMHIFFIINMLLWS